MKTALFAVLLFGMVSSILGDCFKKSMNNYGCDGFDHSTLLGGNHQIDKITKIEVYTGTPIGWDHKVSASYFHI